MQAVLDHHNPENELDEQQYDEDFQPMNSSVIKEKNSKIQDNNPTEDKNEIKNSFTKQNNQNKQDLIDNRQVQKQFNNITNELSGNQFFQQTKKPTQIQNTTADIGNKKQIQQSKSNLVNDENLGKDFQGESKVSRVQNKDTKQAKQEDKESQTKDKINKIKSNIIVTKQSIVDDITSIDQYYRENEKQIKNRHQDSVKIKLASLYSHRNIQQKKGIPANKLNAVDVKNGKVKVMPMRKDNKIRQQVNLALQQQKSREEERKRKKEIYMIQRQAKKQQQLAEKNQSRMKKNQIQKRIMYEQKFISRRQGHQIPISNQQIKAFEDAFIQQIKQRFNMGKSKVKATSLEKLDKPTLIKKDLKNDQKKKYNKKIYQNQKFKEKIYINLKQQIKEQFQPTYQSIQNDSKQISGTPISKQKNRSHESAPHLFLPSLYQNKQQVNTFYSKDNSKRAKVHILKLSDENNND